MPRYILGVKLYTIDETAELLDVTYETTLKYIRRGKLASRKIGGRRYCTEENILAFLQGADPTQKSASTEITN